MTIAASVGITIAVAYLLGSIPAGYIAGLLGGIDIRKEGSCNVGATNVVRVLGKRYGYPVFIFDLLKGVVAVLVGKRLADAPSSMEVFGILAGVVSVVGHMFPIWLKFKGGKGVATSIGVISALMPAAALVIVAVWLLTFALSRYVSVASIAAAIALPVTVGFVSRVTRTDHSALFYFSICLAVLITVRHRDNVQRLLNGTEPRFRRK